MTIQNLTGQILGQYELRELLGAGGMGVAYRAHQQSLERDVAVKVLSTNLAIDPDYIDRFYREEYQILVTALDRLTALEPIVPATGIRRSAACTAALFWGFRLWRCHRGK